MEQTGIIHSVQKELLESIDREGVLIYESIR